MTSIDNGLGFGPQAASGSLDHHIITFEINDNKIYGESGIPDCPQNGKGGYCIKINKQGLFPPMVNTAGKPNHPTSPSANPYHKVKGDTGWGGVTILNSNEFINFRPTTKEGMRNSIFASADQPDYTPMLQFYNTTFTDVDGDALAKLSDPDPAWANVKDCGDWPCTGPLNVLYAFKESTIKGSTPDYVGADFQIISNNKEFAPHVGGCSLHLDQNAYLCQTRTLGILLFDSLDSDRLDRTVSPVFIRKQGTSINNKLNSMMDHSWDGFYSSQKRQTRFPTIVDIGTKGHVYDIVYTGTPPNK